MRVSILGLMESVFRVMFALMAVAAFSGFNPWFNGICIQGGISVVLYSAIVCFNPWFNGICIQGSSEPALP